MVWWIIILAIITFMSYLSDVGAFRYVHDIRVPGLNASILSVLLLFCMIGTLGRLMWKVKKGEKEILAQKIIELERELKALRLKEK